MKVVKFGGSSLANAERIKNACNIIAADERRKLVVVSAPGKRFEEDIKITDILISLAKAAHKKQNYSSFFDAFVCRFEEIINDLVLGQEVLQRIKEDISQRLAKANVLPYDIFLDLIKAAGEDNSAYVVAQYLCKTGINAKYLDPCKCGMILSDLAGNAQVLPQAYEYLQHLRDLQYVGVFPGYFGISTANNVVTFGRGGSDVSGAILAAAVKAEVYENFTDVDSVYAVSPKIVKNALPIKSLSYREMRELAYAGFSVLQEEAVESVYRHKIPTHILNTFNPCGCGTLIEHNSVANGGLKGIAGSGGFVELFVGKFLMNREIGFGRSLFEILEQEKVSFDHAPSGIDSITPILRDKQLDEAGKERLIKRIKTELNADFVQFSANLALIVLVGECLLKNTNYLARATNALFLQGINTKMATMSASGISLTLGVDNECLEKAIQVLYREFFESN